MISECLALFFIDYVLFVIQILLKLDSFMIKKGYFREKGHVSNF